MFVYQADIPVDEIIDNIAKDAEREAEQIPETNVETSRRETGMTGASLEIEREQAGQDDKQPSDSQDLEETVPSREEDSSNVVTQTGKESDKLVVEESGDSDGKGTVEQSSEEAIGDGDKEARAVKETTLDTGRSRRPRNAPKKYGQTPEDKGTAEEDEEAKGYDALAVVSSRKQKALTTLIEGRQKKDLSVLGQSVTKAFYKELYKPKCFVTTTHMEAILALIWARRGDVLLSNRVGIMDGFFVNYLIQEYGRYSRVKNPQVPFPWSRPMQNYVAGNVKNRSGRLRWLVDVDYLYAAMNWGTNHWVALAINLLSGTISIMDCNENLYADRKLSKFMKPVTDIMPLVLRDLGDAAYDKPESFEFMREIGLPQNERGGDCGPMTAKFIELNSQGLPVDELTDADIDNMRMKYAVDVYEENQDPL